MMSTPVKLLMSWNIRPGREESYLQFITQEFPESMVKAQLQPSEAWYTIYGIWPEVTMGFVADDLESLRVFLNSDTWARLRRKLAAFIKDYRYRVVPLRGGFQF